jgi:hypothetical protein
LLASRRAIHAPARINTNPIREPVIWSEPNVSGSVEKGRKLASRETNKIKMPSTIAIPLMGLSFMVSSLIELI